MAGNKLTPKQEAFCLAYIETGNASEAYRRSYSAEKMKDATVHRAAKELFDNPKITARLVELQAHHQERHDVTVDSLTEEYEEAREMARVLEMPSAMVQATTGKGRVHGLVTNKNEITGKNGGPIEIKDKTPAAVKTALDAIFQRNAST